MASEVIQAFAIFVRNIFGYSSRGRLTSGLTCDLGWWLRWFLRLRGLIKRRSRWRKSEIWFGTLFLQGSRELERGQFDFREEANAIEFFFHDEERGDDSSKSSNSEQHEELREEPPSTFLFDGSFLSWRRHTLSSPSLWMQDIPHGIPPTTAVPLFDTVVPL